MFCLFIFHNLDMSLLTFIIFFIVKNEFSSLAHIFITSFGFINFNTFPKSSKFKSNVSVFIASIFYETFFFHIKWYKWYSVHYPLLREIIHLRLLLNLLRWLKKLRNLFWILEYNTFLTFYWYFVKQLILFSSNDNDNDNSLPSKEDIKSLSKSNDLLKSSKDFLIFSQSSLDG